MPESLSPELNALRALAERFAQDVLMPCQAEVAARDAVPDTVRERVVGASRKVGLFRMTQPQTYGGTAAGPLALTLVRDTLAGYNTGLDRWCFGPPPGVLDGCTEPLRSAYLIPMLSGEKRAGFAFTEPDDAIGFTKAVAASPEMYLVTGGKSYVTRGAEADFLNTLVEIEGEGRAILVIDTRAPGVTLERRFETLDGSHHAAFRFDAVAVPANRMVGRPGDGLPRALRQIGDTRLAIAARAVGLARWVIEFTHGHLQSPHRSGNTLASREGVRLRYADMRIQTFAARSMLYRTARLGQAGVDIVNESIACKVFVTETLGTVVDAAIQLVGGEALGVGHPLERLYRQARALRIAEGASDVLRLNLARGALDLGKGVL